MLTQSEQANAWGHACYPGPFFTVALYGAGHASIRQGIAEAASALSAALKAFDYKTEANDTGGFCCRAKTGDPHSTSNHGRGIAIDVNWRANPYGKTLHTDMPRAMTQSICAMKTKSGAQVWNWGGNWSGNKDAMHFEIVCTPADLLSGINWATVPDGPVNQPPPTAAGVPSDADLIALRTVLANKYRDPETGNPWGLAGTGWPAAGETPNGIYAAMVQQALNLIVPNTHLVENGVWGPDSQAALETFQSAQNAFAPGSIPTEELGVFGDDTKFYMGVRLDSFAHGKP